MLEKKTMSMADFNRPQDDVQSVEVIADAETGKVEIYSVNDEGVWRKANDRHHFYATKQEAQQALEEFRRELRRLMPQVKVWIFQMEGLLEIVPEKEEGLSDDEMRQKHPDYFTSEDYLPGYLANPDDDDNYYYRCVKSLEKENTLLVQAATRGTLTVRGNTFRINDVVQVRWGDERAELVLTDNRTVETACDYEYNVVKHLYGDNPSGYTYTRLNKPREEEE